MPRTSYPQGREAGPRPSEASLPVRNGARAAEKALQAAPRFCPVGLSTGQVGRRGGGRARDRGCELGGALLVSGIGSRGIEVREDGRTAGAVAIGLEAIAENGCELRRQSRVRFRDNARKAPEERRA